MINKIPTLFKSDRGVTIMELLVTLGVVGLFSLIVMQFLTDQNRQTKKIEDAIEYKIDSLLSDKVILKDYRLASVSINQLHIPDNNNLGFYDFDATMDGILYNSNGRKFRILTLDSSNAQSKRMYVLIQDTTRGNTVFTDPVIAYNVGNSPTDLNQPAPLTYVGLNRDDFLSTRNPRLLSSLLFIDSSGLMSVTTNNKASRSAAFIGFSTADKGDVVSPGLPDNIFVPKIYSKNPQGEESVYVPTNFDDFLRNLPPSGAAGSNIRIMPVKLIKYELECSTSAINNPTCDFFRSEWAGATGFINKIRIMQKIESVTFTRESITNTTVSVAYKKAK